MRLHIAGALSAIVLSTVSALAQLLPAADPYNVGLSADRLYRLTLFLKEAVASGKMPSGVIAVARKGKFAYFKAAGYRDRLKKAPMAKDYIFSIASMAKPMVSIAAVMLMEDGRLLWPDPIGKFLLELAEMKVGALKVRSDGSSELELVKGGCAVSTAADYIRFGQMPLTNGTFDGKRYGSILTSDCRTRTRIS